MRAANDVLSRYQHIVETMTLTPGSKGVFDVTVDGTLLYSKAETGRHADPGEVLELFVTEYAQGVSPYQD